MPLEIEPMPDPLGHHEMDGEARQLFELGAGLIEHRRPQPPPRHGDGSPVFVVADGEIGIWHPDAGSTGRLEMPDGSRRYWLPESQPGDIRPATIAEVQHFHDQREAHDALMVDYCARHTGVRDGLD